MHHPHPSLSLWAAKGLNPGLTHDYKEKAGTDMGIAFGKIKKVFLSFFPSKYLSIFLIQ